MQPAHLRRLLDRFRQGEIDLDEILEHLAVLPFEDVGDALIDHHRVLRRGFPEVIFGEGKSPEQIVRIAERMIAVGGTAIASRLSPEALTAIGAHLPTAAIHREARLAVIGPVPARRPSGAVVCCAGTTDIPVAEEAALTLEALGHELTRLNDVGVAGLHRLLAHHKTLTAASLVIAVAGMEGALPSVVAGMVACPVIGIPTSVGYGVALGGISALLAMLNSCAGGLLVVNIDNGIGAALAAHAILRGHPSDETRLCP